MPRCGAAFAAAWECTAYTAPTRNVICQTPCRKPILAVRRLVGAIRVSVGIWHIPAGWIHFSTVWRQFLQKRSTDRAGRIGGSRLCRARPDRRLRLLGPPWPLPAMLVTAIDWAQRWLSMAARPG
jgi:hypothetical protein